MLRSKVNTGDATTRAHYQSLVFKIKASVNGTITILLDITSWGHPSQSDCGGCCFIRSMAFYCIANYRIANALFSGLFHDFPRDLVIDTAEMKNTVNNKPGVVHHHKLPPELLGIGAYRIQTDEQVARQTITFAIIESNDIRVIIVLQILSVYLQNLFSSEQKI